MVLAGDSYEMKILCVTEQNYLFFFFPPFPLREWLAQLPLNLCASQPPTFPPGYGGDNIPGWSSLLCFDPEGSAEPGGVGRGTRLPVLLLHMRLHM